MRKRILLAEDEPSLGLITKESIETKGYEVILVEDGKSAYEIFIKQRFDLVILDVMMPVLDGFSCAKQIRKLNQEIPILFLTAKTQINDVLLGFEIGCNDYLKKPFSILELIARLDVLIKKPKAEPKIYKFDGFVFEEVNQTLKYQTYQYDLSYKESRVLKLLLENQNQIVNRELILHKIWQSTDYFSGRSLDVYITKLRKKIAMHPTSVKIINQRGVGYQLVF